MKRLSLIQLFIGLVILIGCSDSEGPSSTENRGTPLEGNLTGALSLDKSPYLAVDTLYVPAGAELTIDPGVEIRFDNVRINGKEHAMYLEVRGKITAEGSEDAPIVFTSAEQYPTRGDWDGIWMIDADPASSFKYCKFQFGAKYGRHYHYTQNAANQLDSTLYEYGALTLFNSNPRVERCWFLASGFHGVHCDSLANPVVRNCVFYDNAGHGVYVHNGAEPVLHYNIIIENDDYGVYFRQPGENPDPRTDATVAYNVVWSNFSGEFNALAPIGMGKVSDINDNLDSVDYNFNLRLNPAFKKAAEWDFTLKPNSSAIDAGPDSAGRDDDGTRFELGIFAYDYRPGGRELRRRILVDRLEAVKSPYYVSYEAILPKGGSLTIEPGVTVLVEGRFPIKIGGCLKSQGTAERPVQFLSAAASPKKGDWIGLIFERGADAGTELNYTTVAHARWGVSLSEQDIIINHCRILETDSIGVMCDNLASPRITDTEFRNNSVAAIYCQYNCSPLIQRNIITGSAGYGIFAGADSRPVIKNNLIYRIGTNGIRLQDMSNATVVNNTIAQCGYFGLYCHNNSAAEVRNNIFYRNGTTLRGGVGLITTRTSLPVIEYNGFFGNPQAPVVITSYPNWFNPELNRFEDPQFQNPDRDDYRLKPGSPYIDGGDPTILDPDGSPSDLGAYGGEGAGSAG